MDIRSVIQEQYYISKVPGMLDNPGTFEYNTEIVNILE